MNTTFAANVATVTAAAGTTQQATSLPTSLPSRLSSLALAAVLTLAMLAGVDMLAVGDGHAGSQLAQNSMPRA